ncbi:hypothetical protein [Flagellimonas nanhaiensis]|uniref:Outer membrane protein beta-barrel domain-containing protein n=1 Tax=Flagellimonas nanhaiensis TaxID=2292706 RepID=A0A371JMF2_9FLAO|nr:hypothetical protein [Allomuricauda nanhaiensis]RDY58319.1 hypothetical protein DX873_15005 [Allomuricauda nanhaiensis]
MINLSKSAGRITVLLLVVQFGYVQYAYGQASTNETPIYIEGFNYPEFDSASYYAWFRVNAPIREGAEVSVGGEHFRSYFADRFNIPVQLKQYIGEKAYLIGGYQWEFDLLNKGRGYPNPKPLQEAFFGVGHEVNPNMLIEAKIIQPIGKPDFNKLGYGKGKTRFELGTKLKF